MGADPHAVSMLAAECIGCWFCVKSMVTAVVPIAVLSVNQKKGVVCHVQVSQCICLRESASWGRGARSLQGWQIELLDGAMLLL